MVGQGKKLGLVIALALALGALVATTASAHELSYRTCVKATKVGKTYTGKYSDKECKEVNAKSEGKYESQLIAEETPYTGKDKTAVITAAGKTVTCKKGVETGEYIAEQTASEEFTFSGCSSGKKEACQSPSAGAGVIKSGTAKTKLVYLNPAETEIGVLVLSPRAVRIHVRCDVDRDRRPSSGQSRKHQEGPEADVRHHRWQTAASILLLRRRRIRSVHAVYRTGRS